MTDHRTEFRARVRAEQQANGGNLEEALIDVTADVLEEVRPQQPRAVSPQAEEKPAEPKAAAAKAEKPAKRKPGRPRKGG